MRFISPSIRKCRQSCSIVLRQPAPGTLNNRRCHRLVNMDVKLIGPSHHCCRDVLAFWIPHRKTRDTCIRKHRHLKRVSDNRDNSNWCFVHVHYTHRERIRGHAIPVRAAIIGCSDSYVVFRDCFIIKQRSRLDDQLGTNHIQYIGATLFGIGDITKCVCHSKVPNYDEL